MAADAPSPSVATATADVGTGDGRHARRARNRLAVVEAILALYRDGVLQPSVDEIAERSGVSARSVFRYFDDGDDLAHAAITHQQRTVAPLAVLDVGPDDPFDRRVTGLAAQRSRLFETIGATAVVMRLRAPLQPAVRHHLSEARRFLRSQVATLFAAELAATAAGGGDRAAADQLAAADTATSFEVWRLLRDDHAMSPEHATAVTVDTLRRIFGRAPR